jgi:hypothetical protein
MNPYDKAAFGFAKAYQMNMRAANEQLEQTSKKKRWQELTAIRLQEPKQRYPNTSEGDFEVVCCH